ncbi:MAG: SoxR reducing system RseC family protein [Paludibacteraceae bacterium]|nr:SoxR reducing system RseC family protein [Paludibacteraceae bacterium]
MSATEIKHQGEIIGRRSDGTLDIRVVRHEACQACKARQLCIPDEQNTVIINAMPDGDDYQTGQTVWVSGRSSDRRTAVWGFYLLPLILVVGVLAAALALGAGEALSALMALGVLGPYLIGLRYMDKKLAKNIRFRCSREPSSE